MNTNKVDKISETEAAVQSGLEKAIVVLDGKEISLIEGLKVLRKTYGLDDDELAKKATLAGNVIQILGHFMTLTFKSDEQRKALKEQAVLVTAQAEKQEFMDLLYKQETDTLTPQEKSRLATLKPKATKPS